MKVIKTHEIWSARIAKNVEKLTDGAHSEKAVYKALLSAIRADKDDELTPVYLRDLGTRIARTATVKEQTAACKEALGLIGLKASKIVAVGAPKKQASVSNLKAKVKADKLEAKVREIVEDDEDSAEELAPFAMDVGAAWELMQFMKRLQSVRKTAK